MRTACGQHAVSMRWACGQHAVSTRPAQGKQSTTMSCTASILVNAGSQGSARAQHRGSTGRGSTGSARGPHTASMRPAYGQHTASTGSVSTKPHKRRTSSPPPRHATQSNAAKQAAAACRCTCARTPGTQMQTRAQTTHTCREHDGVDGPQRLECPLLRQPTRVLRQTCVMHHGAQLDRRPSTVHADSSTTVSQIATDVEPSTANARIITTATPHHAFQCSKAAAVSVHSPVSSRRSTTLRVLWLVFSSVRFPSVPDQKSKPCQKSKLWMVAT